jgi:hypothetical protein
MKHVENNFELQNLRRKLENRITWFLWISVPSRLLKVLLFWIDYLSDFAREYLSRPAILLSQSPIL